MANRTLLVTGGAGFIGANFILHWLKQYPEDSVINLDALTYAGNQENLKSVSASSQYQFVHGSINNTTLLAELMPQADMVVHFAAETHVDRSISGPGIFLQTNVKTRNNHLVCTNVRFSYRVKP